MVRHLDLADFTSGSDAPSVVTISHIVRTITTGFRHCRVSIHDKFIVANARVPLDTCPVAFMRRTTLIKTLVLTGESEISRLSRRYLFLLTYYCRGLVGDQPLQLERLEEYVSEIHNEQR